MRRRTRSVFSPITSSQNPGFTLIEAVIALSISAVMAIALFSSYSIQQRRVRVTDAIESVVSNLEKVKTEVNSGFTTGRGTNPDSVFFGKAVTFEPSNSSYTIDIIKANNSETLTIQSVGGRITKTIPWQVKYVANSPDYPIIVFARNLNTGQLITYVLPAGSNLNSAATYSVSHSPTPLIFEDSEGRRATITVNRDSSQIIRSYEN